MEGSLEGSTTFVGKIRAMKDTLTIDYSTVSAGDFGRLADMNGSVGILFFIVLFT